MKQLILIISFIFCIYECHCQDYNPFRKEHTYQFSETLGNASYSVRIDTAYASGNDSIFIFNPAYFTKQKCSTPVPYSSLLDSNNILAMRMVKRLNGDFLFITKQLDTFLIKTKVTLNQKWFFSYENDVIATNLGKTFETFLGVSDTMLNIKLSGGNHIKISKRYGFLETVPLRNYGNGSNNNILILHAIPEVGLGNFDYDPLMIYNYEVGDYFHTSSYTLHPCDKKYVPVKFDLWKTIIAKNYLGADTIIYNYCVSSNDQFNPGSPKQDTIVRIKNYALGRYYPDRFNLSNQLAISKYGDTAVYFNIINDGKLAYELSGCLPKENYIGSLHVSYEETIKQSLGLIHQYTSIWNSCGSGVYFDLLDHGNQDISEACSTTTGLMFEQENSNMTMFPNPALDQLNIMFTKSINGELSIYNSIGEIVLSEKIELPSENLYTINTRYLKPGIYQLRVIDGTITSSKTFCKN